MIETIFILFFSLLVALHTAEEIHGFTLVPNPNRRSSKNSQHGIRRETFTLNVDLITFDLDDTIFPVGPVVADANKALFRHLESLGCKTTQEEYIKATKDIRKALAGKAITYTELRKRAIRSVLKKHLSEDDISDSTVYGSYDVWEEHRHISAETHLYPDTVPMLKQLKMNHPDAIIGAITNGKGSPLKMDSIRQFFDFCVSGEDDDVFPLRKPDEGIYKVALERFRTLSQKRKDIAMDGTKPFWIHIGDDLSNDVGASAKCGAKSIWVDLGDEYNQTASKRDPSQEQPAWSTATKEELEIRILMNEEAQQYVSERVTCLENLPLVIERMTQLDVQEER